MIQYSLYSLLFSLPLLVLFIVMIEGCASTGESIQYPPLQSVAATGQHPYSRPMELDSTNKTKKVNTINFLFYLPESYGKNPKKKWPLILFLHGMGERGNDLELLKKHPLPKTLDQQKDFPCIVVSPQLPLDRLLWDDFIDPLKDLLDQIKSKYSVDSRRVYLTGLSMGGAGTWNFALRYPRYFAAIVPIAGAYKFGSKEIPDKLCDLKRLPIWAFHGGKDDAVQAWQTEILVNALKACGSKIKYTLYPEATHPQSWINAYSDPKLYKWLLSKTLKR
jgi:predicted peptidase